MASTVIAGDHNRRCSGAKSSRRKREAGSTLVEFAVIAIIFLTILFGVIGFGDALYTYHFVSNAAREATRWAAVNGANCALDSSCSAPAKSSDVNAYVLSHLPPGIDSANVAVPSAGACGLADLGACAVSGQPTVCTTTANAPNCTVQIQVAYAFQFIVPLLPVKSTTTAPCTQPGFCLYSTSSFVIAH
jgi:Flp pilus assembly protein TadG